MPEAGCVEENASLQGEPLLVGNLQSMPPCLLLMDPNQEAHWPCSTVMVKPSGAAGLTSKDRLSRRDFWWVTVEACAMEKWKSWLRVQEVSLNTMALA